MKLSKYLFSLISLLFFHSIAQASPVNDTGTGIVARAGDCGALNVQEAYFTWFGFHGSLGKALIIKAQIRNDAFEKIVRITHGRGSVEVAENSPSARRLRIEYQGQIGNMDQVELTDRTIGMELSGLYIMSVTMAGVTSECVFQVDRKIAEVR
ncbi:hypothetical protein DOM22_02220 [Bdellovibrio sp. ZAP7]|uniref:hypothetical protein n=1 Tax=Bdellovibrio sp. ZAP7 TaxID=2231053 RepID=UPI0011598A0F|nr:hypothetical protein [Bdellovibrio sp. ZAP7]QDK44057.1 hypothetical protein DOM22_02220 [Bdellovibrio sp. ZAP7]